MSLVVEQAVALLRAGQLVAFPTETVYGLGADAYNEQAVAKLFRLKKRPANVPLTVHLGTMADPDEWAVVCGLAQTLMDTFWPGPLTLILPKRSQVPSIVVAGGNTVGLRMPAHPMCIALLNAFGSGIAAPSANLHRNLSPTSAQHVRDDFGETLPLIMDGGDCTVGLESTILKLTENGARILRHGAISAEAIEHVLSQPVRSEPASAPKYHIGERIVVAHRDQWSNYMTPGQNVTVLSIHPTEDGDVTWIQMPDTPEEYQRRLYRILRHLTVTEQDTVLIEPVPTDPSWQAIRSRLDRTR